MKYLITIKGDDDFIWEGKFVAKSMESAYLYAARTLNALRRQTTIEALHIDCIRRVADKDEANP